MNLSIKRAKVKERKCYSLFPETGNWDFVYLELKITFTIVMLV